MWEDLELDPEQIPTFKLAFHSVQIVLAFVAWCLGIAVFRADGARVVGNNGWTFAVVRTRRLAPLRLEETSTDLNRALQFFLTIPAWIYLMMAPRFPRTRKLAMPQVMVAVDAVYTVIWLSAFATQAAYNSADLCGTACGISKGIVALGVFVLYVCDAHVSSLVAPTKPTAPQPPVLRDDLHQHLDPQILPMEQPLARLRPRPARQPEYRPGQGRLLVGAPR